jgi:hypothetical protein
MAARRRSAERLALSARFSPASNKKFERKINPGGIWNFTVDFVIIKI